MEAGRLAAGLRLAIFDCNREVREALRRRLEGDPRVSAVVAEASCDPVSAARIIEDHEPHAVLIDPRAGDGARQVLAELLALRERRIPFAIGVHVAHRDSAEESAVFAAGCDLYLLKGLKTPQLLDLLTEAVERIR